MGVAHSRTFAGGVCLAVGKEAEQSTGLFVGDTLFAGSIGRTDLPGGDTDVCCGRSARFSSRFLTRHRSIPATASRRRSAGSKRRIHSSFEESRLLEISFRLQPSSISSPRAPTPRRALVAVLQQRTFDTCAVDERAIGAVEIDTSISAAPAVKRQWNLETIPASTTKSARPARPIVLMLPGRMLNGMGFASRLS